MDSIDSAYAELAAAIVRQACSDKLALDRGVKIQGGVANDEELDVFFKGRWCAELCGHLDPADILRRLKQEGRVANGVKLNKADKRFVYDKART